MLNCKEVASYSKQNCTPTTLRIWPKKLLRPWTQSIVTVEPLSLFWIFVTGWVTGPHCANLG